MLSGGSPPGVCVQVWQDVKWRLSTRCVCAGVARCCSGGSPPEWDCVCRCGKMLSGGSPPGVCVQVWQDVEWRLSTRCVCACVARC